MHGLMQGMVKMMQLMAVVAGSSSMPVVVVVGCEPGRTYVSRRKSRRNRQGVSIAAADDAEVHEEQEGQRRPSSQNRQLASD